MRDGRREEAIPELVDRAEECEEPARETVGSKADDQSPNRVLIECIAADVHGSACNRVSCCS